MYLDQRDQSVPDSESGVDAHAKIAIGITVPAAVCLGVLLMYIYYAGRKRLPRNQHHYHPRPKTHSYLRRSSKIPPDASRMHSNVKLDTAQSTRPASSRKDVIMYELEGDYGKFELQHMAAAKRQAIAEAPEDMGPMDSPLQSERDAAMDKLEGRGMDKHLPAEGPRASTIQRNKPKSFSSHRQTRSSLQVIVTPTLPQRLTRYSFSQNRTVSTIPLRGSRDSLAPIESPVVSELSMNRSHSQLSAVSPNTDLPRQLSTKTLLERSDSQVSAISPDMDVSSRMSAVSPLCEGPFWNRRLSSLSPNSEVPTWGQSRLSAPFNPPNWTRRCSAQDVVESVFEKDPIEPLNPRSRSEEDLSEPRIAIPPAVLSLKTGKDLRQSMF